MMGNSPELETTAFQDSRKLHEARNWNMGCHRSRWKHHWVWRADLSWAEGSHSQPQHGTGLTSSLVATIRSLTTPSLSSCSPTMATRGIPVSSQYCS